MSIIVYFTPADECTYACAFLTNEDCGGASEIFLHSFIHSFISSISIAPLLLISAPNYSFHAKASQAIVSEGLTQGPYVAPWAGFEPTMLRPQANTYPLYHHASHKIQNAVHIRYCLTASCFKIRFRMIFHVIIFILYVCTTEFCLGNCLIKKILT